MKLTKEEQDIICQNVIHGERLTEITDKHNINIEQVFIELEGEFPEYSEFQERYARAERIRQHRLIDKIFRLSQKLIVCEDKEEYRKLKLELSIYKWIIRNEKSEVRIGQNDNNSGKPSPPTPLLKREGSKTEVKSKKTEQKAPKAYSANNLSSPGLPDRPLQDLEDRFKEKQEKNEEKIKSDRFLREEDFYPRR